jgi:iron complex outermembrane recepter protein
MPAHTSSRRISALVRSTSAAWAFVGVNLAFAPASWAQTAPDTAEAPQADDSAASGLAEIVVTAQKRSENLQDVPIAITAVSGEQLENLRINSARDLPSVVPGLMYNQAGGTTQTYLRGIGTSITQVNADPSVATYIDGVYISLATVTSVKLSDIESVEVLKGPQGTLYGRNATGGAVSINTRTPTRDLRGEVSAGIGNFDRREFGASISGGLTDSLFVGIYGNYEERAPHSKLENPPGVAEPDVRDTDYQWTLRGKLVFDPGTRLRMVASGDYSKYASFQDLAWKQLQADGEGYGNATIGPRAIRNLGRYSVSLNAPVDNNWQTKGISLRTELDLGSVKLVELSAYRDSRSFTNADGDATEAAVAATVVSLKQRSKQTTHELQLQSNAPGPFQWIVGAFYYLDKGRLDPFNIQAPPFDQKIRAGAVTKSISGFTQLTYNVTDELAVTLGGRYTNEKKRYTGGTLVQVPSPLPPRVFAPRETTFNEFTPKATINYDTGDTMIYASFTEGFKSGVFNLNGTTDLAIGPVNPERLNAYEIGTKSELFGRRVRFNTALFYYDYQDLQVQTIDAAGISSLQNAAKARSYGLDLDGAWEVTPTFELRGNVEFLDAEYVSFPAFQGKIPRGTARGGNIDRPGGVNLAGFTTSRAPKVSGNLGFSWRNEFASGAELNWTGNVFHTGKFAFNPDATVRHEAYTTASLSAEFTPADRRWSVSAWVKNLTNEYYFVYKQINNQGSYGIPAAPRTFGVSASVRFGDR